MNPPDQHQKHHLVLDPVCGMSVDPDTARGGSAEHDGQTYFFCSNGCRERFQKNQPET